MDIQVAVELLRTLAISIETSEGGKRGHPSARSARKRAHLIAEKEALRRLIGTGSFRSALLAGTEAYEREMRYFSPLTLVQDDNEPEWQPSNRSVDPARSAELNR